MKHLITAGLPYINGVKHLGNLVGSMLPADIYARYLRREGHEVLYVCATDEHGAPAEIAAEQEGVDVAAFCKEQHGIQADIYRRFGVSFDYFGRSSSSHNAVLTQEIAKDLFGKGFLSTFNQKQLYSIDDDRFLSDRYVTGTCPHCGYEAARGDQCEHCTKLLDPLELIAPRSAISGASSIEVRDSKHLFLSLTKLEPSVREWVEREMNSWPKLSQEIARKWLNEGLKDRCITRDLKWGIRVPFDGFEDKVFYVWFDAPIEYIGATSEWFDSQGKPDEWKDWWLNDTNVKYTQFMGKDNLPFHTIMFPAMLLGTGKPWKKADQIKGFHWLNYYGGKFSTSSKRGVFTDAALEEYPADYWRYFLMSICPESADSNFTWELFAKTVNKDLAGILGNFVNRVFQFSQKNFGSTVPVDGVSGEAEVLLRENCSKYLEQYCAAMDSLSFREAVRASRNLWSLGNLYVDEKAPWSDIKNGNKENAAITIRTCFNLISLFAIVAEPFVPDISNKLLDALNLKRQDRMHKMQEYLDFTRITGGHIFESIPILVKRIEESEIENNKKKYG